MLIKSMTENQEKKTKTTKIDFKEKQDRKLKRQRIDEKKLCN